MNDGIGQVAFPVQIEHKEKCLYCEKFIDIDAMDKHVLGNHGRFYKAQEKILCVLCGSYIKRIGMDNHLRSEHDISAR